MSAVRGSDGRAAAPVRAGETFEVEIDNLGYRGEGVGRHNGFAVFVPGALQGERVRVRAARVARSYAFADLLDVLRASPRRVAAPCPAFGVCGGCQLQHMSYDDQLTFKRRQVVDALTRIGKFDAEVVERLVARTRGMDEPWRYRNKVSVAAASRDGRFVAGFMEEGTHDPVSVEECLIRPAAHDRILGALLDIVRELGILPYDERTGRGHVRQVVVRTSAAGDVLVVVEARGVGAGGAGGGDAGGSEYLRSRGRDAAAVSPGGGLPHGTELARRLALQMPAGFRLAGAVVREFRATGPGAGQPETVVERTLWGTPHLQETVLGLHFRVSAGAFLQVNPAQTEVLYSLALDAARIRDDDVATDLYCGIGTLTLLAARRAAMAIGVESVAEAVADARHNAAENRVTNARFMLGRTEDVLDGMQSIDPLPTIVMLDPPRAGCGVEAARAIASLRPRRVVYTSCNPATLARDLRALADEGYVLESVAPVDMFPQTAHVECVVSTYRVD